MSSGASAADGWIGAVSGERGQALANHVDGPELAAERLARAEHDRTHERDGDDAEGYAQPRDRTWSSSGCWAGVLACLFLEVVTR